MLPLGLPDALAILLRALSRASMQEVFSGRG